jgi:signal transduction histidine kinase
MSVLARVPRTPGALVGAAVAVVGAVCLGAGSGVRPPSPPLLAAALAAVFGAALLACDRGASVVTGSDVVYAGIVTRLTPSRRTAWLIRVLVLLSAPIAGAGVAVYALAALVVTLAGPPLKAPGTDWHRSAATGFLGLSVVLAADAAHVAVGGAVILWAILLIGSGLALFWGAAGVRAEDQTGADSALLRIWLGLVLTGAGVVLVITSTIRFDHAGTTVAATATSLAVLGLVGGPYYLRTRRLLGDERIHRARVQERADMADHLHDSVLQTLALIQRRADDPGVVAGLAHRQERDLRDWLLGRRPALDSLSLENALRAVVADVEDAHRAQFDLVIVGDAPVDERLGALLGATREALVNAARHAPGADTTVFARVEGDRIAVYVRDRGPGFELDEIPDERRGVEESIIGRMHRNGGNAVIRTAPGEGCEVVMTMPRK